MNAPVKTLRLICGDQLSCNISSLKGYDQVHDHILMCEVLAEAQYVKHHKKKIAFLFSAMRHFAEKLRQLGYRVHYRKLDDPDHQNSFEGEVRRFLFNHKIDRIIVTQPSEYRVLKLMENWQDLFKIPVEIRADERFLCSIDEFTHWASGRKTLRMEFFYREMRKKYNILMDGEAPIGGKWNYDAENRKTAKGKLNIPARYHAEPDAITQEVLKMVEYMFKDHFGDLEPFYFAVTREQALKAFQLFLHERLDLFGDYQDAMIEGEAFMYHSHISFYLNAGLLEPLELILAVQEIYQQGKTNLNAVEGFIRQIMGWREYIRGIYWLKMPEYKEENFLNAQRDLPKFYWNAHTKMNCLHQVITETKQNAYAHHIQRLMIVGNFALLANIDPKQVNEWFLIVYADAYEWVELPNVSGMILFADGGYLASKPYAAGGSYINKMSNYCKNCSYKVSEKQGASACPFNYLYWDFLMRNHDKLDNNPRIAMMYKTLGRMDKHRRQKIKQDSQHFLTQMEQGKLV